MATRTTISSAAETTGTTIVIEGASTAGIAVDYTPYVMSILSHVANVDSHLLNIRNDIHHLRILGDHNGSGIRTTTPYAWMKQAYYYKWFINEGHIVEPDYQVSASEIANAISYMDTYMGAIGNNFPGIYNYGAGWDTDEQPLTGP